MTAEKGKHVKHKKSAAVVAGTIMAMGMAAPAVADTGAGISEVNSPGILSGISLQVPLDADVNACGNTVDVLGFLNPADGNACASD
jgi:hypothetical protein